MREEIIQIIEKLIGKKIDNINDADLIALGLDSMRSINLVVELEVSFNILFDDDELLLSNFSSIDKIYSKVTQKLGGVSIEK